MIAYTSSEVLREHGYIVIAYTDPTQVLGDAESFLPDVMISDVEMPRLGGVYLVIQAQTLCPSCKAFLMSEHTAPIEALKVARDKGFRFPVFPKPVSAQTFAD